MIESLDQRGCPYMADSTAQNLGTKKGTYLIDMCLSVRTSDDYYKYKLSSTNFTLILLKFVF